MTTYSVDNSATKVVVSAKSSVHDTNTRWDSVEGKINADPDNLLDTTAFLFVDMTKYDAGDFLKNRKIKKDLQVSDHPMATFELRELTDLEQLSNGQFKAAAHGSIEWRGRTVEVVATGQGSVDGQRISATAEFEVNVRDFGVTPPKFLMFKVEEVVAVKVTLVAVA